jgi:hypothetical protein
MGDDNIVGYEDTYVQNPDKHPMETLAALIKERGWDKGRIGVEMDNYYYSAAAHRSLTGQPARGAIHRHDGPGQLAARGQEPAEIEYMRRAARIVEAMHRTIVEKAEPGMPKNELVAEIYRTGVLGADGHWGDYPAIVPMAPSGMDATAPHLTWDDYPLQKNESTFFEIAGAHLRYHCPQSRTLFIGKPPQKYLDAEKAVLEGIEAGLEQAKTREPLRGYRQRVQRDAEQVRLRQGQPLRLCHRRVLPAGLGRADDELPARRHVGSAAGHDVPFHAGAVARRWRAGDHRADPDHRDRRRVFLHHAAPAFRQGLTAWRRTRSSRPSRSTRTASITASAPALQPRRFRLGLGDDPDQRDQERRRADGAGDRRQSRRRI